MNKLLCFTFCLFLSIAPAITWGAGLSGVTTIKTLHIESSYFAWVVPPAPFSNPDACGSSQGALLLTSNGGYQEILVLLMEAYAIGANVQFYFSGCATTPWGFTAPVIYSMDINP
jgi:hypothetical protein